MKIKGRLMRNEDGMEVGNKSESLLYPIVFLLFFTLKAICLKQSVFSSVKRCSFCGISILVNNFPNYHWPRQNIWGIFKVYFLIFYIWWVSNFDWFYILNIYTIFHSSLNLGCYLFSSILICFSTFFEAISYAYSPSNALYY